MGIDVRLKRFGHYSPLRYPGGKAALAGVFDQVVKSMRLSGATYVEPFAGGAGAALTLLYLEKVDKIVINDLDPAVYAFWETAVNDSDWFAKRVLTASLTVDEWRRQRSIYLEKDTRNQRELGFSLFYLNRTNRSGIVEGWPIGGLDQSGLYKIDARFNRAALASRIRMLGNYQNRIEVRNEDGVALAREFLQKPSVLVYLDPPYFVKGKSLYLNHYLEEHHRRLAELLNSTPNSSWLLTYDNVQVIRDLYAERRTIEFSLSYSVHSRRKGSEILVTSDQVAQLFS